MVASQDAVATTLFQLAIVVDVMCRHRYAVHRRVVDCDGPLKLEGTFRLRRTHPWDDASRIAASLAGLRLGERLPQRVGLAAELHVLSFEEVHLRLELPVLAPHADHSRLRVL